MKKTMGVLVAAGLLAGVLSGCSYAGAAGLGADKVVVLRNDTLLFGILRKAFVCKVSEAGLSSCSSADAP